MHIGFFAGFRGNDTVLVSASAEELLQVSALLRGLEDSHAKPLHWHQLPEARILGCLKMTSFPVSQLDRIEVVHPTSEKTIVRWWHSEEGWLEVSEKLERLARSSFPGHQYLTAGRTDAVIMVSKDEYDTEWWRSRGPA